MSNQTLVDEVRRVGRVDWYNPKRGFGFLRTLIGKDGVELEENVFAHVSNLRLSDVGNQAYKKLSKYDVVEFSLARGEEGRLQALDITGVTRGPLPCQGASYVPMVRYGGRRSSSKNDDEGEEH